METFVLTHPGVVLTLLSLIFAALIGSVKLLLRAVEQRMNEKFAEVEEHNTRQDRRLDGIDARLRDYDTHVAVGASETREIHDAIKRVEVSLADHVTREEGTTWVKIDNLVTAVSELKTAHEVSSATVNTRLAAVERKMPNGELGKLADAFARLAEREDERLARTPLVKPAKVRK